MSKTRFPVFLEPQQLDALRAIESDTGAPIGESIRRAIDAYLAQRKPSALKPKRRTRADAR